MSGREVGKKREETKMTLLAWFLLLVSDFVTPSEKIICALLVDGQVATRAHSVSGFQVKTTLVQWK